MKSLVLASGGTRKARVITSALRSGLVDVLVCDVQLPDRSGADVAARFGERHRDLEVVYMSGAAPSRLRELLPTDTFVLTKPFAISDLVAAFADRGDRRTNRH